MQWLEDRALGLVIRVEVSGTDRYGRRLGHVLDERGKWLNEAMVRDGLAWHYVKYNKDVRLAEAQQAARADVVGLWQDARKITPWDYRNGQRIETALPQNLPSTRDTDAVVDVTETGAKYHRSDCRYVGEKHC